MANAKSKRNSCDGKFRFVTKNYAKHARSKMRRLGKELPNRPLVVYKCDYCEFYHLGSKLTEFGDAQ